MLISALCACFTGNVFSATRATAESSESNTVQKSATISRTSTQTNLATPPLRQPSNVTRRQENNTVVLRNQSSSIPARDNVTARTANLSSDKTNSARTTANTITGTTRSPAIQRSTVQVTPKSGSRSATTQRTIPSTNKTTSRTTAAARATISINNSEKKQTMSKQELDERNELLTYCQTQYANCMDEYCNILDEDMGRCSCSNNIKNYSKTSEALETANSALQDVAQQIQYIGLSAKDIETLFSETEAEVALSVNSDSSQLKNDLDKIKKMIVEVKAPKSSSAVTDGISVDLTGIINVDFNSSALDLDSILTNDTSNISSISNQRGATLYKSATSRCKANILSYCKGQGINESIVTNSYDLKIDKDCLSYEKFLEESNKNMSNTIRNAENVLRKARLMVRQNANTYDLRGCVTALDECMRSDFVCGSDYENCLDPSGKYIVGGEIVIGSTPVDTNGIYATWGDANPWDNSGPATISSYIEEHIWQNQQTNTTSNDMADFLQYKIGYNDGKQNIGLCMAVLNQCQDITYSKNSNGEKQFNFGNSVIKEYLVRVLPEIKRNQDNILEEYSRECVNEVKTCLSTNGYGTTSKEIAINACKNTITTCKNVTGTADDPKWVSCLMNPTECSSEPQITFRLQTNNSDTLIEQSVNCTPGTIITLPTPPCAVYTPWQDDQSAPFSTTLHCPSTPVNLYATCNDIGNNPPTPPVCLDIVLNE